MIQIKNLTKTFGEYILFKDFDLNIESGEMVAIVGESGSGKSTLLNIIGSIEPYDEGEVIVNELKVHNLKGRAQRNYLKDTVSFIFQNYALMNDKSVSENISFHNKLNNNNINHILEKVGIENLENRLVTTLSGGEQQRVALARVIHKTSKIVLADEPTGNLDEENAQQVYKILKEFS